MYKDKREDFDDLKNIDDDYEYDSLEEEMQEYNKTVLEKKQKRGKKEPILIKKKELKLIPQQLENVNNALKIIGTRDTIGISCVCRDSSDTGLGKTFSFMAVAKELGLDIFNICPASVLGSTLGKIESTEGVSLYKRGKNVGNISYSSIILNNPWVYVPQNAEDDYIIREEFKIAVDHGILFVCDEFQKTKNEGRSTSKTIAALSNYIVRMYNEWYEMQLVYEEELEKFQERSTEEDFDPENELPPEEPKKFRTRIYFSSATQMDNASQAQTFLKIMGIISSTITTTNIAEFRVFLEAAETIERSFSKESGIPEKLKEIQEHYAEYYGTKKTPFVLYNHRGRVVNNDTLRSILVNLSNAGLNQVIYSITTAVIFNRISCEIEPYLPRICFNGFFDFDTEESKVLYKKGLVMLTKALNKESEMPILEAINKSISLMQMGACGSACEYLYRMYKYDTTSKIILAASFKNVLYEAEKVFIKLGIPKSEITYFIGDNNKGDRVTNLKKFQEHTLEKRVLLMTTSIGAGFDAHDTNPTGNRRYMVVLRNYSAIDQHQATGRIFRLGMFTYGIAHIWNSFIYGPGYNAINSSIKEKSEVLDDVTLHQEELAYKRFFPGNYPRYIDCAFEENSETDVHGLYINEERLKELNNGNPVSDAKLILSISGGADMIPIYDPPIPYFTRKNDDCPVKVMASTDSKGTEGIYRINPRDLRYEDYSLTADAADVDLITEAILDAENVVDKLATEREKKRKERKKVDVAPLFRK